MTLADFYLTCFIAGLAFSLLSVFGGGHHAHGPHAHVHVGGHHGGLPHINFATVAAFIAWFGGTGYLLTRYYNVWVLAGLAGALAAGVAGSALVFYFAARFLIRGDEELNPADYDMVGVYGKISSVIRTGGMGEMIYSQGGTRRATAVRSEDGAEIPRGAEVVVTRYERGVAWVKHWDELAGTGHAGEPNEGTKGL